MCGRYQAWVEDDELVRIIEREKKGNGLRYLRQDVAVYAQEGGDLSPDALRARFGAPEEYAAECMERQEVRALARRMNTARFVKRALLITAVTIAVIAVVLVIGVALYNNQEPQPWPAGVPFPTV